MEVFCTTPDGLEFVLKEEILTVVDESVFEEFVECKVPGIVRFKVNTDVPDKLRDSIKRVHRLRSVEHVCGLVLESGPDYPFDDVNELERLAKEVGEERFKKNWVDAMRLWHLALHSDMLCEAPLKETAEKLKSKVLFRCTGRRLGKGLRTHKPKYKSPDVERTIGGVMSENFSWKASMVMHTLQTLVVMAGDRIVIGVCLHGANQVKAYYEVNQNSKKVRDTISVGEFAKTAWEKYQYQLKQDDKAKKLREALLQGETIDIKEPATKDLIAKLKASTTNNEIRINKSENSMIVPIGHALVKLSDIKPGDIVCDPLAGSGTTLLEASLVQPHTGAIFGGDMTLSECSITATNIDSFQFLAGDCGLIVPPTTSHPEEEKDDGAKPPMKKRKTADQTHVKFNHPLTTSVCHWNATSLPIRTGSVDVVITDLPFGNRCAKGSKKAFPMFFEEFARILRPGGRLTFLAVHGKHLDFILGSENVKKSFKTRKEAFKVNMGEMYPSIYCFERV
eukprot:TRINITY_DN2173_c0_g2_i1.p1 TRINITY_DN2173_c0_g2~~TRINITY_DN2173_c0_g2_i1.p1  ORF type:complete len:507 (+),score=113.62 TRINITY_DN2173_c0_g2_i1:34-1554(+)